ncbi:MAG TPA: prolipoprotein diacylglyceryl transferase, partial [Rhodobacteraceae bacterium]|nr:prolipoprotein diacylglyceryl transferase [Paracoccaceae bacterium]
MLTYPQIDPIALQLGPIKIHWYGLMYLVGFALFWALGRIRARRSDFVIQPDEVSDLLFYGAMGVVIGGRIGYVLFYGFFDWLQDPLYLFRIWEGGMSFHGGLLGVMVAVWLYARKLGATFLEMADFVAPMAPLGLMAGRIGNFINGELWGRPTDLPWGMVFPHVDQLARHPSQLYQAGLEGLLLFLILWWY